MANVYYSTVHLYKSNNNNTELDHALIKDIYNDIFEQHSKENGGYKSLSLNPDKESWEQIITLDILPTNKDKYLFGRICKQKENNAILKRNYDDLSANDVFTPSELGRKGIEVYTYFLLDFEKGIFSHVSAQGIPKASIFNNILEYYNSRYYTSFTDIPNDDGIQILYNAKTPQITGFEFEITMPNAEYLQDVLGLKEEAILNMLEDGVKKEYNLEELTEQYYTGLCKAYNDNYNIIIALAKR